MGYQLLTIDPEPAVSVAAGLPVGGRPVEDVVGTVDPPHARRAHGHLRETAPHAYPLHGLASNGSGQRDQQQSWGSGNNEREKGQSSNCRYWEWSI